MRCRGICLDPSEWSGPDRRLWFGVAHRHPKLGASVLMTPKWTSYVREFERLSGAGIPFEVWCGTFRDVDAFRGRYQSRPHDE